MSILQVPQNPASLSCDVKISTGTVKYKISPRIKRNTSTKITSSQVSYCGKSQKLERAKDSTEGDCIAYNRFPLESGRESSRQGKEQNKTKCF